MTTESIASRKEELQEQMLIALDNEDYMLCAQIRDSINACDIIKECVIVEDDKGQFIFFD